MLNPPAPWTNAPLHVYHGTTAEYASIIQDSGIRVTSGQGNTDFGLGFYTTTLEQQAQNWAWVLSEANPGSAPAVVRIDIDRHRLATLDTLSFVRGDRDAEDFWSFVVHCRSGAVAHGRTDARLYDVVFGPVAAFWRQRVVMYGSDQISFHTDSAERLLNASQVTRVW